MNTPEDNKKPLKKTATEMNGTYLENLNESQYEFLKQFKRNIADVLPDYMSDIWLVKWLRGHNYSLKKTEALFRAYMRVREVYEFDSIVQDYVKPEVVSKYGFTSFLGIAKNGSPIRYTHLQGDVLGFLMSLSGYEICLYCSYVLEYDMTMIRKQGDKMNRDAQEVTYIVNCEGFAYQLLMNKAAVETGIDLVLMMQDFYPEIWGNILLINIPSYFDRAVNMFKPILRLNLLQKINTASRENAAALLLKYVDEDVLPAFLGGKRTDSRGDPKCSEFIPAGGIVPPEYYLRNLPPLLPTEEGATSLWVPARSVYNHSVVVRGNGSWIRVEIRSENGSIGLKMLFREMGNDPDRLDLPPCDEYLDDSNPASNVLYVSPPIRLQAHFSPVNQLVKAPWPGIYIFRFDNTHSWFNSRRIIFRIRIDPVS